MTEINTQGGAAVQGDVAAHDLTMRDRYDQRASGSSVTFQNPDSAELWRAILSLGAQMCEMQSRLSDRISGVDFKLDDLPNRVNKLEVKVDPLPIPVPVMIPILLSVWISIGFGLFIALLLIGAYFIIV